MRTKIIILHSIIVLAALNYGIYEKEKIKVHGETLLLELTSSDPRLLIQGDRIRLYYTIERSNAPTKKLASHQHQSGYIVIRPDENNVAQFIRFHKKEDLVTGEKLLHFHKEGNRLRIVPNSFFFQEGHAKHYENAKYGIFKFDDSGKHLLVGLADEHKQLISPL